MAMKFLRILLLAGLLGGVALPPSVAASDYTPVLSGTIQSTDFLKHTVTIDGRTYAVTPATTYSGNMSLSLLHSGMRVEYYLAEPATSGTPTIVRIIVLPS